MNAFLTILFAMLIVLVLVAAWSTFIGGGCTKDSQCPAGYSCSGGKCVPKGSFSVDPNFYSARAPV
jgi:Cys-rich repeat protein